MGTGDRRLECGNTQGLASSGRWVAPVPGSATGGTASGTDHELGGGSAIRRRDGVRRRQRHRPRRRGAPSGGGGVGRRERRDAEVVPAGHVEDVRLRVVLLGGLEQRGHLPGRERPVRHGDLDLEAAEVGVPGPGEQAGECVGVDAAEHQHVELGPEQAPPPSDTACARSLGRGSEAGKHEEEERVREGDALTSRDCR